MSSSKDGASDGGGGATTSNPLGNDGDVDSILFEEGEKVLTLHGSCLYDAKVQKIEFLIDRWRYYVHYMGWKTYWDEWLGPERLFKRTEENLQKQRELKEKHAEEKKAKNKSKSSNGVRGRKRKHESNEKEGDVSTENLINIQIPSTLKQQLVDDHECVTQLGQLVKLPRSPNVFDILNKYFEYRVKKDGKISNTGEITKGLHMYFDKALPAMLLYHNEHQQFKEMVGENIAPSSIYGAEHLLRLFVKLPELLDSLYIEKETMADLQQKLIDFLRFLQTNHSTFFISSYQTSEGFSDAIEIEDD